MGEVVGLITGLRRFPVYEFAVTTPLDAVTAWSRIERRFTLRLFGVSMLGLLNGLEVRRIFAPLYSSS